jgi:sulfatase maturation enzyme AslB (radical SAM superfamily)
MAKKESSQFKSLVLSSNLSVIHPKIFNALQNTQAKIYINASIDGPIKIHEYIRYGCDWKTIAKNLQKLKSICYGIGVNTTISAMNVGYLHELVSDLQELERETGIRFTHIMPTPVLEPHLHVGNLPKHIKKLYKEKLVALQQDYKTPGANTLIQTGISLLESNVSSTITVVKFMEEFDAVANTDYRNVYPEWL